jgi:hypothetical protein
VQSHVSEVRILGSANYGGGIFLFHDRHQLLSVFGWKKKRRMIKRKLTLLKVK